MAIWLWEAGSRLGIAGDEESAVAAATENLSPGQTARVEEAALALDRWLMPVYKRTGAGRIGRVVSGRVRWDDLRTTARA